MKLIAKWCLGLSVCGYGVKDIIAKSEKRNSCTRSVITLLLNERVECYVVDIV